ncbi:PfkB family carbohydrate kinase [Actinoplanes sp. KI2]|uniref:1-phosphofructokinase family hexose kinase n=1 Tax=Actinoplanes sp. KI2 TaxID=2983315 RepID=UPI0021D60402|nr:PfkB family carbohydrate kinase [Actinoplanes sp. KI2]MCU7729860.1 PfkB family carbohydrate kinase [Actinoplanes sp. KI2]
MSDARVMVFAPAPQLTVTIEQQHDQPELHVHPGGQGIWQTRMITSLGAEVTLCAAVGGEVGRVLKPLLDFKGVTLRTVQRETGSGWYVHDRRDGQRRSLAEIAGAPFTRHELDELYNLALAEGLRAGIAILSGPAHPSVIRPDVYRRLAADLRANGCKVIADLCGDHLKAVLSAGLDVVKVSHEELIADGLSPDDSEKHLTDALVKLHHDGAQAALVSRADMGALALINEEIYRVGTPRLTPTDGRGAGDSMTAGVATVLARGGEMCEAVRTGAAAGALNVTRHGLGTGHLDAVHVLTERIKLTPIKKAR